jgi:hypothetical protein
MGIRGQVLNGDTVNAPRSSKADIGQETTVAPVTVDRAGKVTDLADGSYRLLVRARRLFGNSNALDGYETMLSDVFVVQRGAHRQ